MYLRLNKCMINNFLKAIFLEFLKMYKQPCRVATWSRNQESSGKTKKNDKSQVKMGFFEKSQEKSFK